MKLKKKEDHKGMVRELLDHRGPGEMSAWELNFLEDQEDNTGFSIRQGEKVSQIWHRVFS